MNETNSRFAEANLLYAGGACPLDRVDAEALGAVADRYGAGLRETQHTPGEHLWFAGAEMEVLVAFCPAPFPGDHFRGALRPAMARDDHDRVLAALRRHRSSLTVLVALRSGVRTAGAVGRLSRICAELSDFLLAATAPDLVFWCATDTLYTAREAEAHFARLDRAAAGPERRRRGRAPAA